MADDRLDRRVEAALSQALGGRVTIKGKRSISGGSINQAERLKTSGGDFFLKYNHQPLPGLFTKEAQGLLEMKKSGTPLRIPEVIAVQDAENGVPAFLVLEYLQPGPRLPDFDQRLGEGLAVLHQKTADRFGFFTDNYCGATPQPNPWTQDWAIFYRDHRLGAQLKLAAHNQLLNRRQQAAFEKLLHRVGELIAEPKPTPSLIHGDLWSGNVLATQSGEVALIDPAAYYGHPEAELGMMKLFGGFSQATYDAYRSHAPLQAGWEERIPLYELYHVMNHANLFGSSYVPQAMHIVDHFTKRR